MELTAETIKGLWAVAVVVAGALCTWIGWKIKARLDHKQKLAETETELEKGQKALGKKLDRVIELQTESAILEERRLSILTEGLELSLDSNEVILQGLHNSKLVNGPSEVQMEKIKNYKRKLYHSALERPQEDFDPTLAFQSLQNKKELN